MDSEYMKMTGDLFDLAVKASAGVERQSIHRSKCREFLIRRDDMCGAYGICKSDLRGRARLYGDSDSCKDSRRQDSRVAAVRHMQTVHV